MRILGRVCGLLAGFLAVLVFTAPGWAAENELLSVEHNMVLIQEGGWLEPLAETETAAWQTQAAGDYEDLLQLVYDTIVAQKQSFGAQAEVVLDVQAFALSRTEFAEHFLPVYRDFIDRHPELFFVRSNTSYAYNGATGLVASFTVRFQTDVYTAADLAAFDHKLAYLRSMLLEPGMTAEDIALAIHDYLVLHCAYDTAASEAPGRDGYEAAYTAYGALMNGQAVCQGYTLAYNLLLAQAGIEAVAVTSQEMGHAWSLVCLNGLWYHVDVTGDDPVAGAGQDFSGLAQHKYFLLSDATIAAPGYGYSGWPEGTACPDQSYETGKPYCDNAAPFFYYAGAFYAVKDGVLIRTDFHGRNQEQLYGGTVALEQRLQCYGDQLYLLSGSRLLRYDLGAGQGLWSELGAPASRLHLAAGQLYWGGSADVLDIRDYGQPLILYAPTVEQAGSLPQLNYTAGFAGYVALENCSAAPQNGTLLAAYYDAAGKLLAIQQQSVALAAGEIAHLPLQQAALASAVETRLFVVASSPLYQPLAYARTFR